MKQVYDTSLVAEQIEGVPLMTLLDRENHDRFSLYAGAYGTIPRRTIQRAPWSGSASWNSIPTRKRDDVLNERRRSVVNSVQTIVARRDRRRMGPGVEFHVASAIVMMMELEKRARQVALDVSARLDRRGHVSLYFSFRTWRTLAVAVLGGTLAILLVLGWLGAGGARWAW